MRKNSISIPVQLALEAQRDGRQGLAAVLVGLLCGVLASLSSSRFLANLFEGVKAMDAAGYALSAALLLIVAVLSIWVAAHRIAWLNIVDILRAE